MNALISVILPIYNMELYLGRCLDSVLNNTYRELEVICVDDGSKDRSLEILRQYEARDKRIVVITKENGGLSSARNAGLDRMTGDYVSFVDPDDWIHPHFFELLLRTAQTEANCMAICGYRFVEDKDLPLQDPPITFEPEKLIILNRTQLFQHHNYRSYCWRWLIPAKLLQGLRFRKELSFAEDSMFLAELGERNPVLTSAVLDAPLYYYFQREGSLVRQAKIADRYRVTEIFTQKCLAAEGNDTIYLDQAVKRGLSTRYYAAHIHPDREIARKCTALLKSCLPSLRSTSIYSRKRKAIYSLFILFPGIYWLYRSITEPDMWKWEKWERKKRREERKNGRPSP